MKHVLILFLIIFIVPCYALDPASVAAIQARIQPIGKVYIAEQSNTPPATDATMSSLLNSSDIGAHIFVTTCSTCHANGVAGAPKYKDKNAWQPRITKGIDTLLQHVKEGYNAMPPRGTCSECTDTDLRKAIEFMMAGSK